MPVALVRSTGRHRNGGSTTKHRHSLSSRVTTVTAAACLLIPPPYNLPIPDGPPLPSPMPPTPLLLPLRAPLCTVSRLPELKEAKVKPSAVFSMWRVSHEEVFLLLFPLVLHQLPRFQGKMRPQGTSTTLPSPPASPQLAQTAQNAVSNACKSRTSSHLLPSLTRSSDEYADIKSVKLLRRGRRLQQVEYVQPPFVCFSSPPFILVPIHRALYGNTSAVDLRPSLSPVSPSTLSPSASAVRLPTMQFLRSDFFRRLSLQSRVLLPPVVPGN